MSTTSILRCVRMNYLVSAQACRSSASRRLDRARSSDSTPPLPRPLAFGRDNSWFCADDRPAFSQAWNNESGPSIEPPIPELSSQTMPHKYVFEAGLARAEKGERPGMTGGFNHDRIPPIEPFTSGYRVSVPAQASGTVPGAVCFIQR